MSPRLSSFLDVSRWVAAFVVAFSHVRHLMLVDYRNAASTDLIAKGFYLMGGLGHEAVMVFFVISGYLVGGLTITRYKERGFDLRDFGAHRFSRIYTVLLPALIIGGLLDIVGAAAFNATALYTAPQSLQINSLYYPVINNLTWPVFFSNLGMMEGILTPHLGSNGALWSLAYEWWYYVLFAAAMIAATTKSLSMRAAAALLIVALCLLLPVRLMGLGIVWLLGIGAAVYAGSKYWKPPAWVGIVIFLGALAYARVTTAESSGAPEMATIARDIVIGLGYALWIVALAKPAPAIAFAPLHAKLASFSYSLYLVHLPMMLFAVAALHDLFGLGFQLQPTFLNLLASTALLAFLCAYAWAFSLLTEAHTNTVRRTLMRRAQRPALTDAKT